MSKRPRYASGSSSSGGSSLEIPGSTREREPKLISAEFAEFRKRHVKQNKEIINTNISVKGAMAAAQAELYALRSEILEMRQRNLALSRELRKRSQSQGQYPHIKPAQRQAVEAILAAVPALQQLLATSLAVTPPTPESYPDSAIPTPPAACQMPFMFTSRPAAIAAAIKNHGLGTLVEGLEGGSDADPEDVDRREPSVGSTARTSGLVSPPTRFTSPPPGPAPVSAPAPKLRPLPPAIANVAKSPLLSSPSSRASPRRKSRGGEKARRRRESGLLTPLVPAIPAEHLPSGSSADVRIGGEGGGDDDGRDAESEMDEDAVHDLIMAEDVEEGTGRSKGKGRAKGRRSLDKQSSPSPATGSPADDHGESAQSAAPAVEDRPPARLMSEELGADEGEGANGGRGRRSRNSVVSYKEPSLHTKMRKPDGTIFDDPAKPLSLHSRSTTTPAAELPNGGPTEQPTSTPSTTPAERVPTPGRRSKSSKTSSGSVPSTSLRRKSALPGRKRGGDGGQTDPGTSDEDEGETDRPPVPPLPRSVSGSSAMAAFDHPPISTKSDGATNQNRTSPRKSPHKSFSESAEPRPHSATMTSSRSLSSLAIGRKDSAGRGRNPLIDRNDNGQTGKRGPTGVAIGIGRSVSGDGNGGSGEMRKASA